MAWPGTRRPHRIRPHMPRRASLRYADDARRGAVVGNPNLTAGAPVVVVRLEGHIQRLVVFVAIAQAAAALALTTAVGVGDDVVMPVGRIVTGPDPGDGRGLGAGRAAVCRATAAGTQESVDGAMPPVLTALRVAGIRASAGRGWSGRLTARHRQQRHARSAEHQGTNTADEAPPGDPLRHVTCQPFYPGVDRAAHVRHSRGPSGGNQDGGSESQRVHASQVLAGSRVVDVQSVVFERAREQQRLRVLRHLDGTDLVARGNGLHSPARGEIVYPDLLAEVLVRLRPTLMHDREQPAATAMHGQMLQSAGTPVLRKLLRREQWPGGSRFDSGGSAAKRMQHPFEGCEQPGVSPAYTLLGKRIVQHIDEGGRTGAVGHLAFVRQRGDKERTIATDREERSRASGINERAAGNLDLAHELPRARVHDSE